MTGRPQSSWRVPHVSYPPRTRRSSRPTAPVWRKVPQDLDIQRGRELVGSTSRPDQKCPGGWRLRLWFRQLEGKFRDIRCGRSKRPALVNEAVSYTVHTGHIYHAIRLPSGDDALKGSELRWSITSSASVSAKRPRILPFSAGHATASGRIPPSGHHPRDLPVSPFLAR